MNALGTVWIIGLMFLINSDILARSAFDAPIAGVPELVSFSIVGIVFLQLAHTLRTGALTRSDVLLAALAYRAPKARAVLLAAFNLIGAGLMAIVASKILPIVIKAWEHPERHFMGNPGFFVLPQWPLFAIIFLGVFVTALQFTAVALAEISTLFKKHAQK
ncbi:TRAP transporter small permease subunit [Thalassovita taeanensis]|nr:TRAP transporter small permease subunit [Thalassovita taeanensis]